MRNPIPRFLQNPKSNLLLSGLILLLCLTTSFSLTAQDHISKKEAKNWVKKGSWRTDLQIKPDASINAITFETQYKKHENWWKKAFNFLNRKDLADLADGNYPIVGKEVYAAVSSYVPVNRDEKQWEAHRKYADIQMVLTGAEKIGKTQVSKLKVSVPYDPGTDNENLKGKGKFYTAKPGTFFIFFPGDAHKPGIKVHKGAGQKVKKIVIKMKVD